VEDSPGFTSQANELKVLLSMRNLKFQKSAALAAGIMCTSIGINSYADEIAEASSAPVTSATLALVDHYRVPYEPRRTLRTQMSNQALADLLSKVQGAKVRIVGRADEDPASAPSLARKRAINVRNYLVRGGVPATSISVETDTSPNARLADGGFASDVYVEREAVEVASSQSVLLSGPPSTAEPVDKPKFVAAAAQARGSEAMNMLFAAQITPPRSEPESEPSQAWPVAPQVIQVSQVPQAPSLLAAPLVAVPRVAVVPQAAAPAAVAAVVPVVKANMRVDTGTKEAETPPKALVWPHFEITTGVPIDEQFRKFASKTDWTVIWAAPDFVVDRALVLPPDFEVALTSFLQSANASGARLRATVYRGNRTVRVEEY